MALTKRIDYVRLRIPFDTLEAAEVAEMWRADIEDICTLHGFDRRCYANSSYFDQGLKKRIAFFNVWGEPSEPFFHHLSPTHFRHLLRLDYREELITEQVDWDNLFHYLRKRNQGKGTVKMIDSPHRSKANGRDIGGTGIMIGAESSDRRLTVYQRAKEGPAVEYHMAGAALRAMVAGLMHNGAPLGSTLHAELYERLRVEAHAFALKKTGLTIEDIEAGTSVQNALQDYTDPDAVLTQLDLLWEVLPPEAKEAFIEAHTDAEEAAVARAVDAELFVNEADWEETPQDAPPTTYGLPPDKDLRPAAMACWKMACDLSDEPELAYASLKVTMGVI